jgi:hypothetical protein
MFPEVITFPRWDTNKAMLQFIGSILTPEQVKDYNRDRYINGDYYIGGFDIKIDDSNVAISINDEPANMSGLQALSRVLTEHIESLQQTSIQNSLASLSLASREELTETLRLLALQEKYPMATTPGNIVSAIVLPVWSAHRVMIKEIGEVIETQIRLQPSKHKWVPVKLPKPSHPDEGGEYDTWQLDRSGVWQATFKDEEDTAGFIWIRGQHAGNAVMLELEEAIIDQVCQTYGWTLGDDRKWQCKPSESGIIRVDEAASSEMHWMAELNQVREQIAELYT